MKYIKNISLHILFIVLACCSSLPATAITPPGAMPAMPVTPDAGKGAFKINDEDLDLLESMGLTRDQAQEMASMVNNLPPEEQQALAQIGQEIEKEMKTAGIDPNDPEQLFNYFSSIENGTPPIHSPEMPNDTSKDIQPYQPKPQPKIQPINPKAASDVQILLDELLGYIASLRQKAHSSAQLSHRLEGPLKQELDELTYYLHVLTKEDLKPLILAKESSALHKSLVKLHEILATYEPLIQTKTSFEEGIDDPYKTLNLKFGATNKEIQDTFAALKEKYDPEVIKESFEELRLSEKDISRKLKEAKLNFSSIKSAYESLTTPQEKAQIDRALKNRELQKNESIALTDRSFTQCSSAITNAFYQEKLIQNIQSLLAKYAPEEKKKADEWEKTNKAALEAQKKLDSAAASRAKSSQTQGIQGLKTAGKEDETGKRFWDTYRPAGETPRLMGQRGQQNPGDADRKSSEPAGGAGGSAPSKGAGSKGGSSDKKSGDKKKEDKKSEKKDDKDGGKKEPQVSASTKDFAKAANFTALLHPDELENLKKVAFKGSKKPQPTDYREKGTIRNLFFNELPVSLMTKHEEPKKSVAVDEVASKTVLDTVDAFMKEYNLEKIAQDYKKLSEQISEAKKEEVEAFKPIWQEFAQENKGTIDNLKELIQNSIGMKGLPNNNGTIKLRSGGSRLHRSQLEYHDLVDAVAAAPKKGAKSPSKSEKTGSPKPTDRGYLKYVRTTITTIVEQFEKLSGKLSTKVKMPEATKAVAPKKADADESGDSDESA